MLNEKYIIVVVLTLTVLFSCGVYVICLLKMFNPENLTPSAD